MTNAVSMLIFAARKSILIFLQVFGGLNLEFHGFLGLPIAGSYL